MSIEPLRHIGDIRESDKPEPTQSFDPDRRIIEWVGPYEIVKNLDQNNNYDPDRRVEDWDGPYVKTAEIMELSNSSDLENTDSDVNEIDIEKLVANYIRDVISKSEYPETLQSFEIDPKDIRIPSSEEKMKCFSEYVRNKEILRTEWEKEHGIEWPRYKEDVIDENGNVVRHAGDPYDAHHLLPRSLGGENTASNITPMHVLDHYDHRGVHATDSPYNELRKHVMENGHE